MTPKGIDPTKNVKNLSDDEISRLFHLCNENVDLFLKLMPGHPWFMLLKKDPSAALRGLAWFRDQP
jgi:hypothetical protein